MKTVPKRRFCCIPARVSVFISAVVGGLLSGAAAAYGWMTFHSMMGLMLLCETEDNTKSTGSCDNEKSQVSILLPVIVAQAALHSILVLIMIIGLLAAIRRNRSLASVYCNFCSIHFAFSLGLGVWALFDLYRVDLNVFLIFLAVRVGLWVLEFVGCWGTYRYLMFLDDEERLCVEALEVPKYTSPEDKLRNPWNSRV